MSVQDLQDELIQDVLVATSTLGNLYGEKREGQSMSFSQPDQALKQVPHRLPHFHFWLEVVLKTSAQSEACLGMARGHLA